MIPLKSLLDKLDEIPLNRELGKQERRFPLHPVGIKYICEHCQEGEMKVCVDAEGYEKYKETNLLKHVCNKCQGVLFLPKEYPYIEWIPVEDL